MQALIDELQQTGVQHAVKLDENQRCTQLLIVPEDTQALTFEFPNLLHMDPTYRTNKYNMPLLHVVGRTNTNKTFTMAVCFMRSERTQDYLWALQAFHDAVGE